MQPKWIAVAGATGVATFLVAYLALTFLPAPAPPGPAQPTTAGASARGADATATGLARIAPGRVAIAVPVSGLQVPLQDMRPGDRLDVLALLPETTRRPAMSGTVARGATVLQPALTGQPGKMLVELSPDEAMVLAHLLYSSVRLNYTLWGSGGTPSAAAPMDLTSARARLGLPALPGVSPEPTQVVVEPTPLPTPQPTPTSVPRTPTPVPAVPTPSPTPERYVVERGDTLTAVAEKLNVDLGALWWANRDTVADPNRINAGQEMTVPRFAGRLYRVQRGETLEVLARRYGLPVERLQQVNELAAGTSPAAGMPIFIPDDSTSAALINAVLRTRPLPAPPQSVSPPQPIAPGQAAAQPTATPQPTPTLVPTPTPVPVTERIAPGKMAVSLPIASGQLPLLGAREGDRLNVLATLPAPPDARPTPSVVLERARVLLVVAPPGQAGGILVEVSPEEAGVLAELIHRQVPLTYVLWSAFEPPAEAPAEEAGPAPEDAPSPDATP